MDLSRAIFIRKELETGYLMKEINSNTTDKEEYLDYDHSHQIRERECLTKTQSIIP